jgi:hypothetical protein
MSLSDDLYATALCRYREGSWALAQVLCQTALVESPEHVPALQLLGLIALQGACRRRRPTGWAAPSPSGRTAPSCTASSARPFRS